MFVQSDRIRDYVFPIAAIKVLENGEWSFEKFLGTGFLIGNNGFALTAGHIVNSFADYSFIVGMFSSSSGYWEGFKVLKYEVFSQEDVGLIQLSPLAGCKFLNLNNP